MSIGWVDTGATWFKLKYSSVNLVDATVPKPLDWSSYNFANKSSSIIFSYFIFVSVFYSYYIKDTFNLTKISSLYLTLLVVPS